MAPNGVIGFSGFVPTQPPPPPSFAAAIPAPPSPAQAAPVPAPVQVAVPPPAQSIGGAVDDPMEWEPTATQMDWVWFDTEWHWVPMEERPWKVYW
jgi:hypothetical protein